MGVTIDASSGPSKTPKEKKKRERKKRDINILDRTAIYVFTSVERLSASASSTRLQALKIAACIRALSGGDCRVTVSRRSPSTTSRAHRTEGRRASGADHAVRRARAFSGSVLGATRGGSVRAAVAVGARVRRGRALLGRPVPTVLGSRSGRRASAPERVRRMPCARGPGGWTKGRRNEGASARRVPRNSPCNPLSRGSGDRARKSRGGMGDARRPRARFPEADRRTRVEERDAIKTFGKTEASRDAGIDGMAIRGRAV